MQYVISLRSRFKFSQYQLCLGRVKYPSRYWGRWHRLTSFLKITFSLMPKSKTTIYITLLSSSSGSLFFDFFPFFTFLVSSISLPMPFFYFPLPRSFYTCIYFINEAALISLYLTLSFGREIISLYLYKLIANITNNWLVDWFLQLCFTSSSETEKEREGEKER